MKFDIKALAPYLLPILLIVIVNIVYFLPQFEGKVVRQGDIIQYKGMSKEATDYYEKNGEVALWTNSMFGGMPTYQISMPNPNNQLSWIRKILMVFVEQPSGFFIFGMISFYILMLTLRVNPWLSLLSAFLFGFITNNFILYEAGHNTKVATIMSSPLIISGVLLVFKERLLLGCAILALGLGLNLQSNHPQMTYYLALCMAILVIIYFVNSIKSGKLLVFAKAMAIMTVIAIISLGSSASKLWSTYEYTKATMRGGQVLKGPTETPQTKGGLEWDYAMQWSNGTGDVLATFIPKIVGGGSGEWLDGKSVLGKAVGQRQPFQFGTYFGSLPFTSGPAYFGIVAFLLFIFGLFAVKGEIKWWVLGAVIFTILLSMGKHFELLNKLMFDYFPLYNKFRAPSSILSVTAIFIPLLGILALSELSKSKDKSQYLKPLYISFGILAGICITIWIAGTSFFDLSTPADEQYAQIKDAVLDQRADMMSSSALRSLIFLLLASGIILGFIKEKLNSTVLVTAISILGLVDLVQIGKGYLDKRDFVSKSTYKAEFEPRQVDIQILQDKDPNFRVLDASINTFNSASTSYFHKTIGGYSAVKMQRYQDIIDRHISNNNMGVFNMLNTKYFIVKGEGDNATVQRNPAALGNAWFVNELTVVPDANTEIDSLTNFDPSGKAIIHQEFKDYINGITPSKNGSITMSSYSPNKIEYQSDTQGDQFAVFSEIWYGPDLGWQAYVDDKPVDHIRANYVLRGLKIPSGKHKVTFEFKPKSYYIGENLSLICSSLIIILLLTALFFEFKNNEASAKAVD